MGEWGVVQWCGLGGWVSGGVAFSGPGLGFFHRPGGCTG